MADEALLRMVKDAVDHGVTAPHKASGEEAELAADGMRLPASMAKGRERLTALAELHAAGLISQSVYEREQAAIVCLV